MGSIVVSKRRDKATGKELTRYRAHVRREGYASKSKVFDSKRAAQDWLRENEATITLSRRGSGKTLRALIDDFVAVSGCEYAKHSHLDFWIDELGARRAADITHADIAGVRTKLLARPAMRSTPKGPKPTGRRLTPATVNRYLSALSAVFNFGIEHGVLDAHPIRGRLKKLKESGGRTRILEPDEEQRLYAAARASEWPMLYLFVRLCLTTGARKSEVLKLKWRQIDIAQQIAVLPKTKNGRPRALPLVTDVCEALAAAEKDRPPDSEHVFFDPRRPDRPKTIDTAWRKCRQEAELWKDRDDPLDRVFLHSTRHTAVTKMLRGGANLAQAAVVSGHQTLAMLKRYEHLAAKDAVDLAQKHLGGKGGK